MRRRAGKGREGEYIALLCGTADVIVCARHPLLAGAAAVVRHAHGTQETERQAASDGVGDGASPTAETDLGG